MKRLAQGAKCGSSVVLGFELVTSSPVPSRLIRQFLKHSQGVCDVFKNFITVLLNTTLYHKTSITPKRPGFEVISNRFSDRLCGWLIHLACTSTNAEPPASQME